MERKLKVRVSLYISGGICIVAAIAIFYIREHYKLNRWNKILGGN